MLERWVALGACVLLISACSTVTVNPSGTQKRSGDPSWSHREHYFFWGLAGEKTIDLDSACNGGRVLQTQAQSTFGDGLLSLITIGIWAPRHAKVWCEQ